MPQITLRVIALLAIAYLAACAVLYVMQRSLIYFPQPRSLAGWAPTISLPIEKGAVLATTRELAGPNALVYFGGNAEDVSYNLLGFSTAFPEHAIYLLHYRGYGGSAGSPSEAALVADALALFDEVHARHKNVVVVGRSLGSGVAVQLASTRPIQRLVLVTPYDSIQELAVRQFPYLPVRWLLQDKYESWRYAAQVTAPTLVIAAENDEVIPRDSTESLLTHFRGGVASLTVIARAGHNNISQSAEYLPLLKGAPPAP